MGPANNGQLIQECGPYQAGIVQLFCSELLEVATTLFVF